jgi:serine/threonine protein kinase
MTVAAERLTVNSHDANIGLVIEGKYEIISRIGRGGMGSVYRAVHRETGGDVAVKIMRTDMVEDESAIRRFYIEAQNTHSLHHPNTVRIADFGQSKEGILFLVMEFVKGRSLQRVLKEEGQLSPFRAVHVISQVFKSLGEAHERGIIHRDIKPDNVMLIDQFGEPDFVKVLDFGISRTLEGTGASTQGAIGTPKYMAPEQWRGEAADARADLYACGGMLYRMLTGRHAFHVDGKGSQQIVGYMTAHLTTPPRRLDIELPDALSALVLKLLAKAPSERPQNARDALETLRQLQKTTPLSEQLAASTSQHDTPVSLNELPTCTPSQLSDERPNEQAREGATLAVANASATGFPNLNKAAKRPAAKQAAYAVGLVMLLGAGVMTLLGPEGQPSTSDPAAETLVISNNLTTEGNAESAANGTATVHVTPTPPPLEVTLSSHPTEATVSTLGGETLGHTPMTLSRRDDATMLQLSDGTARALETVEISHEGFVTQSLTLPVSEGTLSGRELSVTLKPLPVLRVTASTPKTSVRLSGTTAVLGRTPFDWTVSSTIVRDVERGSGATLEFLDAGETVSVVLRVDHMEGLAAIHGAFTPKPSAAKKRRSGKKNKPTRGTKKGSGKWGW